MAWLGIGVGVTDLPVLQHTGGTPTPTPAPSFSVQPSISGTPQVGVSYVGTPGTASNTSYHTYRWLLATTSGGTYTAISGATSASYTPVSGDETKYLKFEDTATGAGGSTVATTTFAGPVAAAGALDAPVLANLSSGWVTGQNPPAWQSTYPNVQGYNSFSGAGDQVRAHWKLGAGAWTATAWEPLDTELATGDAPAWPFLTDGSLAAGGAFQVWEEIVRDLGLGTEQTSAASNTWTDTIAAVGEAASGWETTTGTSKSQYVTTTGGPPALVFQGQAGFNFAPISARNTANRTGKRQFQITFTNTSGSVNNWVGVDDGTTNFNSGFVRPGYSNATGVSLRIVADGSGWAIYSGGSTTAVQTGSLINNTDVEGDTFTTVFDTVGHTIAFYQKHGATTVQLGTTLTLPTLASYYANIGGEGTAFGTAIFGSGQARALDSGANYYDK